MSRSERPARKVCGGCGQPVDDSAEVGKLYWCEWAHRNTPVRIGRLPQWMAPPEPPVGASGQTTGSVG